MLYIWEEFRFDKNGVAESLLSCQNEKFWCHKKNLGWRYVVAQPISTPCLQYTQYLINPKKNILVSVMDFWIASRSSKMWRFVGYTSTGSSLTGILWIFSFLETYSNTNSEWASFLLDENWSHRKHAARSQ